METTLSDSFRKQIAQDSQHLATAGPDALYNPHAMIGSACKCNDCFCCAARKVHNRWRNMSKRDRQQFIRIWGQ